ncbi:LLM class flavin-dependent oxidoreductase [Actinomadura xylanilytica]|uniref:LLM class flavin-dependent oxidoreductase n=1 Tax=Actinomadura xylanilytica TaxID=887459 RepID=UPI00255AF659|nr:LLM class flavin-dependent oxidoreductase [Actinomadura xylanilytica]MDL4773156.1 LLM class flavin-dependent oxidoreductase [Actinomadura xylanilytica]
MSGADLGLSFAPHSGLAPAEIGRLAAEAERAGFNDIFVAEGHGDALASCHPVITATERARVGTAVANAALRPPVLAAKTAALLDDVSGGRFQLGLGTANAFMNSRFGVGPSPSLQMMSEYVQVVRAVLAGSPDGFTGRLFQTGHVPLDRPPVRADLPILLAAIGPRMLALAGRIADGVILNLVSPRQAGRAVQAVRTAAASAGRDPAAVQIVCVVHCCPSDDAEAAAAAARAVVPRYVMHPALATPHGADLSKARALTASGDRAGAAEHVPQQVADAFVAHGDAGTCRARIAQYRDAGVDLPVLFPMPVAGDWTYERVIADLAPLSHR